VEEERARSRLISRQVFTMVQVMKPATAKKMPSMKRVLDEKASFDTMV
jgi:hypothetical protein